MKNDAPRRSEPTLVDWAVALAAEAHRGQVDKGGAPYILHVMRVMCRFSDPTHQVVAALHDTVEDCGIELTDLRESFGAEVSDAVDGLSRRRGESYDDFIDRCGKNPVARSVKIADLEDNSDLSRLASVPTEKDIKRTEKYKRALDRLAAIAIDARRSETGAVAIQDEVVQTAALRHLLRQPSPRL